MESGWFGGVLTLILILPGALARQALGRRAGGRISRCTLVLTALCLLLAALAWGGAGGSELPGVWGRCLLGLTLGAWGVELWYLLGKK